MFMLVRVLRANRATVRHELDLFRLLWLKQGERPRPSRVKRLFGGNKGLQEVNLHFELFTFASQTLPFSCVVTFPRLKQPIPLLGSNLLWFSGRRPHSQ